MTDSANPTFRAQNGEDVWLDNFFGHKTSGFCIEVGAFNGVNLSNTFHFEQIGWSCILVEPDPDKAASCRAHRPRSRIYECAAVDSPEITEIEFFQVQGGEVFSTTKLTDTHAQRITNMNLLLKPRKVAARTLDSILEEVVHKTLDFVSIDVEGAELDVLRGFDIERWQPEIVLIESNSKYRYPAIRKYFVVHGYAFSHSIDVNDFYQRVDGRRFKVWLLDSARYALRCLERFVINKKRKLARSWNKRFGHPRQ